MGKDSHKPGELRVLVVDDNPHLRRHLCRLVELAGMRHLAASNEKEALALASQNVDIIIADIDLSEAGGDERGGILLAEELRERNLKIPLILVSCVPSLLLLPLAGKKQRIYFREHNVRALLDRNENSYVDTLSEHLSQLNKELLGKRGST